MTAILAIALESLNNLGEGVIKWREFLVTNAGVPLGGDSGRPGAVHAHPTGGAAVRLWYMETKERDCTPVLQQKCAISVKCKNT